MHAYAQLQGFRRAFAVSRAGSQLALYKLKRFDAEGISQQQIAQGA